MSLEGLKIGFALTGSFCTFDAALDSLAAIVEAGAQVTAILSPAAGGTDTRFMQAEALKEKLRQLTGRPLIESIVAAEPIGPQKLFDVLAVLPATGNTLAKLAHAITDTPVTMAAKAHLRNERPLLLGISTNDALGNNAQNIGQLLNAKHIYFVPFGQDDPHKKPKSLVYHHSQVIPAIAAALEGRQLQPLITG